MSAQLGVPVLSIVRKLDELDGAGLSTVHTFVSPNAVEAEAFRTLRTALTLGTGATDRIAISSAEPGDGKTTVTANLAVSFAQAGKKTLVIDADLRKPGMTALMGLKGKPGVADILASGENAGRIAPKLVQRSVQPGLDVLPAGLRRPNPAELLNATKFRRDVGLGRSELRSNPHRLPAGTRRERRPNRRPVGGRRDPRRAAAEESSATGRAGMLQLRHDRHQRFGRCRQRFVAAIRDAVTAMGMDMGTATGTGTATVTTRKRMTLRRTPNVERTAFHQVDGGVNPHRARKCRFREAAHTSPKNDGWGFGSRPVVSDRPAADVLLRVVDAGLCGVIFVAPYFFGGRHDMGRLLLVSIIAVTATAWFIRQSMLPVARWPKTIAYTLAATYRRIGGVSNHAAAAAMDRTPLAADKPAFAAVEWRRADHPTSELGGRCRSCRTKH